MSREDDEISDFVLARAMMDAAENMLAEAVAVHKSALAAFGGAMDAGDLAEARRRAEGLRELESRIANLEHIRDMAARELR